MLRSPVVFRTLFILLCLYVFVYPVLRISQWLGSQASIGWSGSIMLLIVSMIGMWYSFRGPHMTVRYFMVNWMGASFIASSVVLTYEILRQIISFDDRQSVTWLILIASLLVIIALITSHHLFIKRIEIRSPKLSYKRRVVQISDVHIGSRQGGFMSKVVKRINQLEPDYVVITGDLIDSSAVEIDALRPLANLTTTTFFCVGNHERYADLPKAINMLETLGITLLRQSSQIEQELQFLGIDDADHREQVGQHLPMLKINPSLFSILLYHRPLGWEEAITHGIDLMLSGHTHNGQIFPFNFLVRQQFSRIRGLYQQESSHLYVNCGTGTWGPLMRLGSLNEISCFDLLPDK